MALEIGRQGYLGLAIESTPGTPEVSPSVFIPFTENSLQDKHEPLMDVSSRASRWLNHDTVVGKKWGEGDIAIYADSINSGYLFKLAFGNETKTTVGADVNDHQFIITASGNTPKSATLWNYRGSGVSVRQHFYSCVDSLEMEITNEDIATITTSFLTDDPSNVSAPTLTTTSGTVFTWKDTSVKFGSTIASAEVATAKKLTNFKFTIANNVEAHYRTGSNTPDAFTAGECEVTGEYTVFLESDTEIDDYKNMNKQSMILTMTGAGLPGATTEQLKVQFRRVIFEDEAIETDLGGVFAVTQTFRCIQGTPLDPGTVDVTLRNGKTSVY